MALTYTLIASNTLGSATASVTFSSIPNTYTDLVLRVSSRDNQTTATNDIYITFNNTTTNYSVTRLYSDGSSPFSDRLSGSTSLEIYTNNTNNATSNTFANWEMYVPSYTANQNKPVGLFLVTENNTTSNTPLSATAGLWRNTAAINEIKFTPAASRSFVSGSSFFLYGIKNS